MKIIKQSHKILTEINGRLILKRIELCGRTCYKSEAGDFEKTKNFVKNIINRGHESVLEHFNITVKFITDRGVTHELVRHRLASFSQESTRYCNYNDDKFGNELTFIEPVGMECTEMWEIACADCEFFYNLMSDEGCTPEQSRSVLPNSLKAEIVMTANLREWRHILKLRTSKAAHPQIRDLMIHLLKELQEKIPIIFDDIKEDK